MLVLAAVQHQHVHIPCCLHSWPSLSMHTNPPRTLNKFACAMQNNWSTKMLRVNKDLLWYYVPWLSSVTPPEFHSFMQIPEAAASLIPRRWEREKWLSWTSSSGWHGYRCKRFSWSSSIPGGFWPRMSWRLFQSGQKAAGLQVTTAFIMRQVWW